jgi:hypothetical protein
MPTGRTPEIRSSSSAARICRSRSSFGGSLLFSSWIQPWMPISWPSPASPRISSGCSLATTAGTKNVALMP